MMRRGVIPLTSIDDVGNMTEKKFGWSSSKDFSHSISKNIPLVDFSCIL